MGGVASAAGAGVDTSTSFLLNLAFANVLSSLLIINLWEEMAWAGFFQRHATARWGYVGGSVVTALMFTGVHLPLSLYGADGAGDVAYNIGAMVVSGIGMRLLIGAFDVWGRGSILTLGLIHATFNASSELVQPDRLDPLHRHARPWPRSPGALLGDERSQSRASRHPSSPPPNE